MTQSLTEWLRDSRVMVVEVDKEKGRLRVKGDADVCSDISCSEGTVVVADDEAHATLDTLNPGDIVRIESTSGQPQRIVVLRRVWEELTSPEL
jgi:hypothetical protein